jgi:hypothetical protein
MAEPTFARVDIKPMTITTVVIANYSEDKVSYEVEQTNKGHIVIKLLSVGKKDE